MNSVIGVVIAVFGVCIIGTVFLKCQQNEYIRIGILQERQANQKRAQEAVAKQKKKANTYRKKAVGIVEKDKQQKKVETQEEANTVLDNLLEL